MSNIATQPQRWLSSGKSKPTNRDDVAELAAWTVVSNVLLNLDETLTKQ